MMDHLKLIVTILISTILYYPSSLTAKPLPTLALPAQQQACIDNIQALPEFQQLLDNSYQVKVLKHKNKPGLTGNINSYGILELNTALSLEVEHRCRLSENCSPPLYQWLSQNGWVLDYKKLDHSTFSISGPRQLGILPYQCTFTHNNAVEPERIHFFAIPESITKNLYGEILPASARELNSSYWIRNVKFILYSSDKSYKELQTHMATITLLCIFIATFIANRLHQRRQLKNKKSSKNRE